MVSFVFSIFRAVTGIRKNTCWKMFISYFYCFTGVGRDDNVDAAEMFVCLLYEIEEKVIKGIDNARYSFLVKAKSCF